MAPIKFEEEIKEKLEERRIEPSEGSWSKLSDRLDEDQNSGINRFWWLAIAASLIITVFSIIQVSKSPEEILPEEGLIVEPNLIKDLSPVKEDQKDQIIETKEAAVIQVAIEEAYDETADQKIAPTATAQEPALILAEEDQLSRSVTKEEKPLIVSTSSGNESAVAQANIDKPLIREVIEESKKSTTNDVDREADSLLKAAQKELLMEKTVETNAYSVNSNELLMEVEQEVEPSLKSKVYEVFKDGLKKVKTAVAQRNN